MGSFAGGCAVCFGGVSYFGAKQGGSVQVLLLFGLLILVAWFCGVGVLQIEVANFDGFFASGSTGLISTAGLVIVSYMGLTQVASVAEEVKDPDRNLPLGMFLAFASVVAIYFVGTSVMVGVVGLDTLAMGGGDLTPAATVAEGPGGRWGPACRSVAPGVRTCPRWEAARVLVRTDWLLSPWMAWALTRSLIRCLVRRSAPRFVRVKIRAWSQFSVLIRWVSRDLFRVRATVYALCSTSSVAAF